MIISHGFAEHGGCYRRVAEALGTRLELDVIAVDYRGHGRSPGRRGVVEAVRRSGRRSRERPDMDRTAVARCAAVCAGTFQRRTGRPPARAGRELARSREWSSRTPRCGSRFRSLPASCRLGRFLARVAPWVTLPGDGRTGVLTRDPEIQEEHRTDPLRHNRMSPPLFFGMVEGGEMLLARAAEIRIPMLMLLGGQDTVIDPPTSREFFDRLGSEDKTLLILSQDAPRALERAGARAGYR